MVRICMYEIRYLEVDVQNLTVSSGYREWWVSEDNSVDQQDCSIVSRGPPDLLRVGEIAYKTAVSEPRKTQWSGNLSQPPMQSYCLQKNLQVNHVVPYLLARKLTSLLEKNKPSRIILVSSICYDWHPLDWEDMESHNDYEKYVQYSRSKLMLHMTGLKLARLLQGTGVTCNILEPGVIETKLLRNGGYHGAPVSEGTRPSVYLAESDKVTTVNGAYFNNNAKQVKQLSADSTDVQQQERLWDFTEKLCERHSIVFS